jgi:hypothetical protein
MAAIHSPTGGKPITPIDPAYDKFANDLSWSLNELSFRTKAALEVLHSDASGIDADSDAGLALSYLMQGIANRAEELALVAANSADIYRLNRGAQ